MSKKKGTNKVNKAAYTDGTPLDRVQYLEAKLILNVAPRALYPFGARATQTKMGAFLSVLAALKSTTY